MALNKKIEQRTARNKKKMLEALKENNAVVSVAADIVGIHRRTHYEWLNTDPEYAEEVDDARERARDFVDQQMYKRIEEGSDRLIQFYQQSINRDRGYTIKNEIDVTTKGKSLNAGMTDEELERRKRELLDFKDQIIKEIEDSD